MKSTINVFEPTQWQNRGIQSFGLPHVSTVDANTPNLEVMEELVEIRNEVYGSYDYVHWYSWQTSNIMSVSYFLHTVREGVHDPLDDTKRWFMQCAM